ncbi:Respiratory-chain NADH dehydrogenase domain 51 kDa subunit [Catenulispora acidiphila DSM 44928]|uniref:Respiratory-chain NADH dehydrogenase domain 51 kDa subunit n=1 Tax=Catenulispora acidiphila (strain DSM 44928 / JCM 14897 / NBRC 102108 / NRRL B-24433 / ID139908) TaxID=479433 RepID=C7Q9V1_CATAD|nr:NADH-ubiquinone oxidoreductase-F iron-sulfur binding region domain-containing protein [Catenulispora acidiphila]ACU76270.1 Respiratory-chain NADH dehydrogenase domain 51 kDa subunit [Catenulispora acidiphila DSM 44928]
MTQIHSLMPGSAPLLGERPDRREARDAYWHAGGYRDLSPDLLVNRIKAAGLRGRGGAGFPAAAKLLAVRAAGSVPVVVANGGEGEPGSVKDRWLMRARPHLVLDGMLRAADITRAARCYVYVADDEAAESMRRALAEREPYVPTQIVRVAHTYVAGEETAVVRRINGGPALPTAKPPRPFESGVDGVPTLVANVETLARIALLAARPQTPDSLLLTVSGPGLEPELVEAPVGTSLQALAYRADRLGTPGVLMGGMFGGILDPRGLRTELEAAALTAAGSALGCGAVHFLAPGECPVALAAEGLAFLADESSRQCGVCVTGTAALARTMASAVHGTAEPDDLARLSKWSQSLRRRGACGLLDAAANLAASLLRSFGPLTEAHIEGRSPCCLSDRLLEADRFRVAPPTVFAISQPISAPR